MLQPWCINNHRALQSMRHQLQKLEIGSKARQGKGRAEYSRARAGQGQGKGRARAGQGQGKGRARAGYRRARQGKAGQGWGMAGQGRAWEGAYMIKSLAQLVALGLVHGLEALSKGHVAWLLVALVGSAVLVLPGEVLMHRNGVLYPLQQA